MCNKSQKTSDDYAKHRVKVTYAMMNSLEKRKNDKHEPLLIQHITYSSSVFKE